MFPHMDITNQFLPVYNKSISSHQSLPNLNFPNMSYGFIKGHFHSLNLISFVTITIPSTVYNNFLQDFTFLTFHFLTLSPSQQFFFFYIYIVLLLILFVVFDQVFNYNVSDNKGRVKK